MDPRARNQAARFVTLIDALYENNVKLFATAAAEPEGLYPAGDGSFEFERTVSRLKEMQSAEYMAKATAPRVPPTAAARKVSCPLSFRGGNRTAPNLLAQHCPAVSRFWLFSRQPCRPLPHAYPSAA